MSVITAIFQALLQALCWMLPISESAHSSVFHDFSHRLSGECSSLTGIVHIGIAAGIVISFWKMFVRLAGEAVGTAVDAVKRKSPLASPRPARRFMLMCLVALAPMLLLLIPVGEGRLLYDLLRTSQFNATLLDDGILLAAMGAVVLIVSSRLRRADNNKNIGIPQAIVAGVLSIALVSVSGLSLVFGVFAVLVLMGVSKKPGYRFSMALSVPVLLVMGVVEIVTSVTKVGVASAIIGAVIAAAVSFLASRVLRTLINKNSIRCFGYYDIALGVIILVVGAFELMLR